jgi:hypothetical protein
MARARKSGYQLLKVAGAPNSEVAPKATGCVTARIKRGTMCRKPILSLLYVISRTRTISLQVATWMVLGI